MTVSYLSNDYQREPLQELEALVRDLFTKQARQLARETGFVQRRSPIDGAAFAQTLVFGFLQNPDASYTDLQQVLACQNLLVSPQALAKRMNQAASRFLHRLVEALLTVALVGERCELSVLSGFAGVYLQDGTIISLPNELQDRWQGSGGRTGENAAVRIQVRLELQRGQLEGPWLQDGRAEERRGPSSMEERPFPVGSLAITDTGYVTLQRMREQTQAGRFYLAPVTLRTKVVDQHGLIWEVPELIATRAKQGHTCIDEPILVGLQERVPSRLIAVPKKQGGDSILPARRDRRARLKGSRHDVQVGRKKAEKGEHGRKHARASEARRRLGGWIVLLTNVPATRLTVQQARELMRARWQSAQSLQGGSEIGHQRGPDAGRSDQFAPRPAYQSAPDATQSPESQEEAPEHLPTSAPGFRLSGVGREARKPQQFLG